MIPDTRLLIPLDELPEFDEVGLWLYMTEPGWISPRLLCTGSVELRGSYRVSLTDASTRDRCLRWLAGRVGVKPIGSGSPRWARWEDTAAWELENEVTWAATGDPEDGGGWRGVPALAGINYTDTTRLPDGSKLIDAVALSLVLCSVRTP